MCQAVVPSFDVKVNIFVSVPKDSDRARIVPSCQRARRFQEETCDELAQGKRCQIGGRWSSEAADFMECFEAARTRAVPPVLR